MNYKAILQYDGTRYRGWQVQGNTDNTIQGKIETLLTRMAGEPVEVNGSGRTDAGVHAAGQVISFRCQTDRTPGGYLHLYESIFARRYLRALGGRGRTQVPCQTQRSL